MKLEDKAILGDELRTKEFYAQLLTFASSSFGTTLGKVYGFTARRKTARSPWTELSSAQFSLCLSVTMSPCSPACQQTYEGKQLQDGSSPTSFPLTVRFPRESLANMGFLQRQD